MIIIEFGLCQWHSVKESLYYTVNNLIFTVIKAKGCMQLWKIFGAPLQAMIEEVCQILIKFGKHENGLLTLNF